MPQVSSRRIRCERMPKMLDCVTQRPRTCFLQLQAPVDDRHVLFNDEMTLNHVPRAHRLQDWSERVVQSQRMRHTAAGRNWHDGAARQGELRQDIQEGLEQPGVGSLKYRCCDDDAVRSGDCIDHLGQNRVLQVSLQEGGRRNGTDPKMACAVTTGDLLQHELGQARSLGYG